MDSFERIVQGIIQDHGELKVPDKEQQEIECRMVLGTGQDIFFLVLVDDRQGYADMMASTLNSSEFISITDINDKIHIIRTSIVVHIEFEAE